MAKKDDSGLKSIPTSRFARATKLTGLTASVGLASVGAKIASAFAEKTVTETKNRLHQVKQAQKIVETLSQMKGAAMKLGQMLSIHGEHLFPKEVIDVLSKLQASSDFMAFSQIDKVMQSELGPDYRKKLLDFTKEPIASASIGQVHRACLNDGTQVAVKVQYPGVDQSIDSDVDSLASLFRVVAKLPTGESFVEVMGELKEVLRLETDYLQEAKNLEFFANKFRNERGIVIPRFYKEYSTKRVLTTELVKGKTVQQFADSQASQELRNTIGDAFIRVFNRELFELGVIQTDPNFGNYKIVGVDDEVGKDCEPKLLLLDFGAVKYFDENWRKLYLEMIRAAFAKHDKRVIDTGIELGFLRADDDETVRRIHLELCYMFLEPFHQDSEYDFKSSDLPQRMKNMVPRIFAAFKFRAPPRNVVFLNRKMVGTYFFLAAIRAKLKVKPLLEQFL